MNVEAIRTIALKDVRAITTNTQVWLPMLLLPLVFGAVMPAILIGSMAYAPNSSEADAAQIAEWLEKLPVAALVADLPTIAHKGVYLVANYMLAPLFLLVPLMCSSVITADSFAGEKERGTLESLLFTPVDVPSLFVAKTLAALVPSLVVTFGTFVMTAIVVNVAGWSLFGSVFFPTLNWLPLLLLVVPMASVSAILVNVLISARSATFQAAYQTGGMVVLPVVALAAGQATGLLMLGPLMLTLFGLVLAAVNFVGLRAISRRLERTTLFESQVK